MKPSLPTIALPVVMSNWEFRSLSRFIHGRYGVKLPPAKKTLLETRLQGRLHSLDMESFTAYHDYLTSAQGRGELDEMIDLVATHKTDFFREPDHFEFLKTEVLPELEQASNVELGKTFRIWSAGCSTGEEAYTLAMVLRDFAEQHPGFHFSVVGTDVSRKALQKAELGVYEEERISSLPDNFKKKYLLRNKDRRKKLFRIAPRLRAHVSFRQLNLMEIDFGWNERMDIIFCRNVIIYFDRPTQESLLHRLCGCLRPGGYIFMGHSETLNGLDTPLAQAVPTVYKNAAGNHSTRTCRS